MSRCVQLFRCEKEMSQPANTPKPAIRVEYDGPAGRRVREFGEDYSAAKAFYVAKDKAGKKPKVLGDRTMATKKATTPKKKTTKKTTNKAAKAVQAKADTGKLTAMEAAAKVLKKHGFGASQKPAAIEELTAMIGGQVYAEQRLRIAELTVKAYLGK